MISGTNPTIHVKKKSPEILIFGTNPEWPRPSGIRTKTLVVVQNADSSEVDLSNRSAASGPSERFNFGTYQILSRYLRLPTRKVGVYMLF